MLDLQVARKLRMKLKAQSRRVFVLSVLALLAYLPAPAQQVAPPQATPSSDAPLKIQVQVSRVLVPVVVRDKHGRVVVGLTKDNFQVFDNDKPQDISGFSMERRGATPIHASGDGMTEAATPGAQQLPGGSQRYIVFVFDDMHLSSEDLVHAQTAAERVLAEALTDSDLAVVVSLSGKTNSGITNDRAKLLDAIKGLRTEGIYRLDSAECPHIDYYQADQMENRHDALAIAAATQEELNCSPGMDAQRDREMAERLAESTARRTLMVGQLDVQSTYAALHEYVKRTAALPGQRMLILVSPGFLNIAPESMTQESQLIDFAAQSNVTISALDARGLYTTAMTASDHIPGSGQLIQLKTDYRHSSATLAENPMEEMADGTGGTYFHNSNDLEAGFKGLTAVPECVYLLELSLDKVKPNSGYHRLKVKVPGEGLQVTARRGYFLPKTEQKK
jgi:VWFA-related protein